MVIELPLCLYRDCLQGHPPAAIRARTTSCSDELLLLSQGNRFLIIARVGHILLLVLSSSDLALIFLSSFIMPAASSPSPTASSATTSYSVSSLMSLVLSGAITDVSILEDSQVSTLSSSAGFGACIPQFGGNDRTQETFLVRGGGVLDEESAFSPPAVCLWNSSSVDGLIALS